MSTASFDNIFSQDFSADEFHTRRQKVAEAIGTKAAALLQGASRPASPHPEFAQSKVFYYLTGISIERCYLLIEGKNAESTLFVPDENICNIKGGILDEAGRSEICSRMKIDKVASTGDMDSALQGFACIYILQRPDEVPFATKFGLKSAAQFRTDDPYDGAARRDELLAENLRKRFPEVTIEDLDPIIGKMRLIKSPAEIEILRKTGKMSARVCIESMKATKPGMPRTAYHAIADYIFRLTGNCGHAYDFILEPSTADCENMVDGDLVLLDCAPDYNCYGMDIGRIWPVNGAFDDWQRHTYGLILDYHKILIDLARPGNLAAENYEKAAALMLEKYKGDEAGTAILNNMIKRGVRYYNHHVGMSAHDAVVPWQDNPLEPGMVLVIDPMVWLDDAPHGYVRVEDTIVITEDGCEVLTADAPIEIDQIEALMQEPGNFPLDLSL